LKKETNNKGEQLKISLRGGARPGAGRPKQGERRTVSLTLHPSVWAAIDQDLEAAGGTMKLADLVRGRLTELYWDQMELMGLELPVYQPK
jgi:hypothetical protein